MSHILVVEDEEHLAKGIRFNLQAEGYQVTVKDEGAAALNFLETTDTPVDLLILDLMLPGMSGYAVCETLRESGNNIPVLMLSARTLPEDRTRGFDVGADQYLSKPFELDELISRIKSLLIRSGQRNVKLEEKVQGHTFQFGEHEINFDSFEVRTNDQLTRVTPLEMRLIQYFVQHEGRVIPRHEILENVWLQPGHISTRAPDQFIRRLRKIFEQDPSRPKHFVTIRDGGYQFVSDP